MEQHIISENKEKEIAPISKSESKNAYNRSEWAGAFGDIGTLIPFALGYITLVGIDPLGLLLGFGVSMLFIGFLYRRPVPVQPMKAIGAAAIAHPLAYGPGVIWGAGLFTGAFWLVVGASGAIKWIARIVARPVVLGIVLGLGMRFAFLGTRMMFGDGEAAALFSQPDAAIIEGWQGTLLALVALLLTLLLLGNRKLPAMFVLLALGLGVGVINALQDPELAERFSQISVGFRAPRFALGDMTLKDLFEGTLFLALAQVPLTLGNAILAVTEEYNGLFPDTPVAERKITVSQGVINLFSPLVGGVPMCHGAGGLASHYRFGARTGGAIVIMGSLLVLLGLFFSESVTLLLCVFPAQVLGVILLFAGLELSRSALGVGREKADMFVMLLTAGLAMWNMGWAFLAGIAVYYGIQWRLLRY